ncbi:ExeM/NucH family extracellular endonuclease [Teredinibacter turnerae]|uniref:ExeM/NucH family extracellular endonuclease n=1 Tax=Teredinibacter turnerae TaxID=2426 RepID=UPI0005F782E1|nr:ExeM/NucH family extracellular endonuclease [Teredinibacter turnerae]
MKKVLIACAFAVFSFNAYANRITPVVFASPESGNSRSSASVPVHLNANSKTPETSPTAEVTLISAIQGTPDTQRSNSEGATDLSPLEGELVKIRGIVVGDFQQGDADVARNLSGFYVQEESVDEDGDTRSSEGIFVYEGSTSMTDVDLGDQVEVHGTVVENYGETQLTSLLSVEVLSANRLSAATVATIDLLANDGASRNGGGGYEADLEAFEGMLVEFANTLTVSEQYQLDRFNEIRLYAGPRPRAFSQNNPPDAAALDIHLKTLAARSVVYDDGLNEQNAEIALLDGFAGYSEASAKRLGDQVERLTGVLDYKWGGNNAAATTWRLRSVRNGDNSFTSDQANNSPNTRPSYAPEVSGNVKVASFNVLNFFKTLDVAGVSTAAGHDPRGADSAAEFTRQKNKLVQGLLGLNADVVGLIELENDFDPINDNSTALELLVSALNSVLGGGTYDYVYPGTQFVGGDSIAVGFIFKPAVVNVAAGTEPAMLNDRVAATLEGFSGHDFVANPVFDGVASNRVSLAVSFAHLASGQVITIAANHFKSKGRSGLTDLHSPDYDKSDGAGFWNQRRLQAARAVAAWLDTEPTGVASEKRIILGDLNAYALEDPIQYLLSQGYHNVEPVDAYSYVFDGQVGTLDYVLVSDALSSTLEESLIWNINADEADALDYNLDFGRSRAYFNAASPVRSSDHDPLLVGFQLEPSPTAAPSPMPPPTAPATPPTTTPVPAAEPGIDAESQSKGGGSSGPAVLILLTGLLCLRNGRFFARYCASRFG